MLMGKTVTVLFDGTSLHPDSPLDLEPNTRYIITIETPLPPNGVDAWGVLESVAGSIEAPADWAVEHNHYLYGTQKQQSDAS
jgi:hypothetical protein